jgi:probable F420-dependent oxidoreductase
VHVGVFGMNSTVRAAPDAMADIATRAEALGFESLWVGEHVVLPDPRPPGSPLDPRTPLLDAVVSLTYLAAVTRRVRLGTGVLLVPLRNPLVLAKELASVDVVSRGRLLLGIGVGALEPEFRAVGSPFTDRGARTDEYLDAMRSLWEDDRPAHAGTAVAFADVNAYPRPVQRPVPVIAGGHSDAALRRAITRCHGWYGFGLEPDGAGMLISRLAALAADVERPASLGRLEITVTPPLRSAERAAYADLGVDRLVLVPSHSLDVAGLRSWLDAEAARSALTPLD